MIVAVVGHVTMSAGMPHLPRLLRQMSDNAERPHPKLISKKSNTVRRLTQRWVAVAHGDAHKRTGIGPAPLNTKRRRIMFKTLIATLILATASVALTSKVNAGPNKAPSHEE